MNMRQSHPSPRQIPRCLGLLALATCSAAATSTANVNTAMLTAESALQAGDCRAASADYVAAAMAGGDLKLLQRASEVSLECGQYALGEKAAVRWRSRAPTETAAALNVVRSQLGRARVSAARIEWLAWLNTKPAPDDGLIAAGIDWLVTSCGSDLTFSVMREVRHPLMNGKGVLLRMAQLAAQAFNQEKSIAYGEAALKAGADANTIKALRLQSLVGLGQAEAALRLAEELASAGGQLALAVPDTLIGLGRDQDAQAELESRLAIPAVSSAAEASLATLQMQRGDYAAAEQHFISLMHVQATTAMAVYNLALIAERRGDVDEAVRGYELLADTFLDSAARNRIAGLYLRDGEKEQALRLLSAGDAAEPQDLIGAELAQANLLARSGAVAEGVSWLNSALPNFPGHPDILYLKSVLLEKIDPNAAIALLESQLRARPDDLGLANALGFTLADHQRDLPRAGQLIGRALAAEPDSPAILDSQGWLLFRRGDKAGALTLLQRAFTGMHDGEIGAHLGEVLWALDRQDEARATWQRALAADPENDNLAATVARHAPGLTPPKPPAASPASNKGNGPRTST